ncbi:MAG: hypothetical protein ACLQOO_15930 [Terriglobia bacterium]
MNETREKLIAHLSRREWWHCPPQDPKAYQKRGKFLASSFREAEFWGRPLDESQQVTISNPPIDDEVGIETEPFGQQIPATRWSPSW